MSIRTSKTANGITIVTREWVLSNLKWYVAIARPDHWVKNVFMLIGTGAALVMHRGEIPINAAAGIVAGFVATCLIASSNYVINEILDAPQDLEHADKRSRPIPRGLVSIQFAYLE